MADRTHTISRAHALTGADGGAGRGRRAFPSSEIGGRGNGVYDSIVRILTSTPLHSWCRAIHPLSFRSRPTARPIPSSSRCRVRPGKSGRFRWCSWG